MHEPQLVGRFGSGAEVHRLGQLTLRVEYSGAVDESIIDQARRGDSSYLDAGTRAAAPGESRPRPYCFDKKQLKSLVSDREAA